MRPQSFHQFLTNTLYGERYITETRTGTEKDSLVLSTPWTGMATFPVLMPKSQEGYAWVNGREMRFQQDSRRLGNFWSDIWTGMNDTQRQAAIKGALHINENEVGAIAITLMQLKELCNSKKAIEK